MVDGGFANVFLISSLQLRWTIIDYCLRSERKAEMRTTKQQQHHHCDWGRLPYTHTGLKQNQGRESSLSPLTKIAESSTKTRRKLFQLTFMYLFSLLLNSGGCLCLVLSIHLVPRGKRNCPFKVSTQEFIDTR